VHLLEEVLWAAKERRWGKGPILVKPERSDLRIVNGEGGGTRYDVGGGP